MLNQPFELFLFPVLCHAPRQRDTGEVGRQDDRQHQQRLTDQQGNGSTFKVTKPNFQNHAGSPTLIYVLFHTFTQVARSIQNLNPVLSGQ